MIEFVHIDTRVRKKLKRQLQKKNSYAANAAKKAEKIINALLNGTKPFQAGKLTGNGDARIKNCLKYDLGKGFRLVCIKGEKSFFLLFAGNHDCCDKWINKNRNIKPDNCSDSIKIYPTRYSSETFMEIQNIPEKADLKKTLMGKISQADLRKIFHGLT